MAIIRVIVIFLLGVGVAVGSYMTGMAQQIPGYLHHWSHSNDAPLLGARSAPVALNITSTSRGDRSACPPEYRVHNRTGGAVFFSFGRREGGPLSARDGIVVPAGGILDPAGNVHAVDHIPVADNGDSCSDLVDIDLDDR